MSRYYQSTDWENSTNIQLQQVVRLIKVTLTSTDEVKWLLSH